MSATINVSASSVKALQSCSLAFYYSRVLRLPEKVWPRTVLGSLTHSLLECLVRPRHQHHIATITGPGSLVDYTLSPSVSRFVRRWKVKHDIADDLIADINGMLYVALVLVDPLFKDALEVYPPEYEFTLDLGEGVTARGFVDRMARYSNYMVIRDFKSQRVRFTTQELPQLIQARLYQLMAWERFKLPARVEFIMLRHPPTSRTPQKHLQVVEPASESQLAGLKSYLRDIGKTMNEFSFEDALQNPCTDEGFCSRVCSFLRPVEYLALVPEKDPNIQTPLRTYPLDNPPHEPYTTSDGQPAVLVKRKHNGCFLRYPQPTASTSTL